MEDQFVQAVYRLVPIGTWIKWTAQNPFDATLAVGISMIAVIVFLGYISSIGSYRITGTVIEAFIDSWIGAGTSESIMDSRLFVKVRLIGESENTTTITTFGCRIKSGPTTLEGEWIKNDGSRIIAGVQAIVKVPGVDEISMSDLDTTMDLINVASFNYLPLEKHKHRDGWLQFIFNTDEASIKSGEIHIYVVDAANGVHDLRPCPPPWPSESRIVNIKPN
jgi:hypothetical protein